ncbi:hypothetical protein BDZ45DRAFT_64972 [Acephala macrosclerotiorum]|nr:hypothetical protein BDZ45DRAFT_64972 [Acephala macrosclerotiorum]
MACFSSDSSLLAIPLSGAGQASDITPAPVAPESHIAEALSSIFASGKYSDLTVKCKGQQWSVHKAVVCMLSRPIGAAFDRGFIEASTGEIDLEDDDPQIVSLMLEYMYKGSLNIPIPAVQISTPTQTMEGHDSVSQHIYQQPLPQFVQGNQASQFALLVRQQRMQMMAMNNTFSAYSNPGTMRVAYPSYGYLSYGSQFTPASTGLMYPTTVSNVSGSNSSSAALGLPQPNVANSTLGLPSNPTIVGTVNSTDLSNGYLGPRSATTSMQEPPTEDLSKGLITAADVYIVADKYDVEGLKVLACNKYKALCGYYWNDEHFIESLSLIFDNTPDTNETDMLRVVALNAAVLHAKELLGKESFQELCQCRGDIATAVLIASFEKPSSTNRNDGRSSLDGEGILGSGSAEQLLCPVDASHNYQLYALPDQYYCHQCGIIRRVS